MACGRTALPFARLSCHPDGAWRGGFSGAMPFNIFLSLIFVGTAFNYFKKLSQIFRLNRRIILNAGAVIV
jgi:hypothetical protein